MKKTLIRNLWYVAGSSDEFVPGQLVGQTIVGLPIVLWRSDAGEVVAFDGRCCHKRMPLAVGKLLGDGTLECAYHGLRFNTQGQCVKIPSQPGRPIPTRARLRPYPIVEQDGQVWIWMGEEANPELRPPRIPELASDGWEMIRIQNALVPTNYLLLIENLLDISHFYPLHDGNIGDIANSEIPVEFSSDPIQGNRSIASTRKASSYHHPPYLEDFFGYSLVDRLHTHKMISPAVIRVDLNCAPPGELGTEAERGYILTHIITPVDERSHRWRLFACCRAGHRYPRDASISAVRRVADQFPSVVDEDLWALAEQQRMLDMPDTHYPGEMHLRSDTAVLKAREIVRQMVEAEAAGAQGEVRGATAGAVEGPAPAVPAGSPDARRRGLVLSAAAVAGLELLPRPARAQNHPPLGNFPEGVEGKSVFIGVSVPLTGAFSAEGKDQQLGFELAFDHLNSGRLVGKIPELKGNGVLGKTIMFGVIDDEAKPEPAIQGQTRFLKNNKAILMTGCFSSATTVALGKLAQREKVLYMAGPAGSDDVTGKDCQRYSFRSQPSTTMASMALAPVLAERLGRNKKVAYLVPDYTFGHTQFDSMARLTAPLGWTTAAKQVCPIGTADFSTYLLNIANSGCEVFVNCTVGNDCSTSIKQAISFGVTKRAALVVPTLQPFLAQQLGPAVTQDILGVMDFWWSLADTNELAKIFVDDFEARHKYKPYWPAHIAYSQMMIWAVAVERARTFYPPEVIRMLEARVPIRTTLGDVVYRPEDHQLIRPVPVMRGKKPAEMKSKDDFYEVLKVIPGDQAVPPLAEVACKMGELT